MTNAYLNDGNITRPAQLECDFDVVPYLVRAVSEISRLPLSHLVRLPNSFHLHRYVHMQKNRKFPRDELTESRKQLWDGKNEQNYSTMIFD
jgi:hypothetical protein